MEQIRTPDSRVRVFVSSTLGELADERAAARAAIERLHLIPVLFEAGARAHPPRALYRAYLDQSDVFVGVYWERYGWVAPGETLSGLADEYHLASGRLPQLVYIKDPAPGREDALQDLLRKVQNDDRLAYRRFSTAEELAELLADDLAVLLSERFADPPDVAEKRVAFPRPPVPLDRTVGRDADIASVSALVRGGHRLVTLSGPGGIGKTRLALEVGRSLDTEFDGSVLFVPLASIRDPALVIPTLAERLGIRLGGVGDLRTELIAELGRRRTLLLLDNFEQVSAASGDLISVLDECPSAVAIVTSRQVLRVRGEREYQVAPLTEPDAAELFTERAEAVRPSFALTPETRSAVEEIARRLDCIPLALELAAPMLRMLSATALSAQLSRRIDLRGRGEIDAPERQRTLRATLDWSHELLENDERRVFARLATFHGSFNIGDAETVCGEPGLDVMEVLGRLVEKSLLAPMESSEGDPRLRMLGTVRDYAAEKFGALPDRSVTNDRHTASVLKLLLTLNLAATPSERRFALARFDADRANHREVVQRELDAGNTANVVALVRGSVAFLSLRDSEGEALQWLEAARPATSACPALRRQALVIQSVLFGSLARYDDAESALVAARELDHAASEDVFDVALESTAAAVVATAIHAPTEALELTLRAAKAWADAGNAVGEAYMWHTASALALEHDPSSVDAYVANALRLAEVMDSDGLRSQALVLGGFAARRSVDSGTSRERFVAAARTAIRSGQRSSIASALDGLAAVSIDLGRPDVAAQALAVSAAARASMGRTAWVTFSPYLDKLAEAARQALGATQFAIEQSHAAVGDVTAELERVLASVSVGTS
jgi:predicted ATPase